MKIAGPIIFATMLSLTAGTGLYAASALEIQTLKIGKAKLTVEIANTHAARMRGLMYRQKLAEDHGMLFVATHLSRQGFWMKHTYIPLAIGFFGEKAKLQQILQMKSSAPNQKHFPIYQPKQSYLYALEVNSGWFKKHKIKIGDTFTLV